MGYTMFDRNVLGIIASNLPIHNEDLVNFASTSRLFNQSAQESLAIRRLFKMVMYGRAEEAEALIAADPRRLLARRTFTDLSLVRVHVERTVFQFALGSIDSMHKMMMPYFDNLKRGVEELSMQIAQQFTAPLELVNNYDFTVLVIAFTEASNIDAEAALKHQNNSKIGIALETFRKYFNQPVKMTTGMHFNPAIFLAAWDLFRDNYTRWGRQKLVLFERQVIWYLGRLLHVELASLYTQRVTNVLEGKQLFLRSLSFGEEGFYFPLDRCSYGRLGLDFSLVLNSGWDATPSMNSGTHTSYVTDLYASLAVKDFCRAAVSDINNLYSHNCSFSHKQPR